MKSQVSGGVLNEPWSVAGSSASKITLIGSARSLKTATRMCAGLGSANWMLYEGAEAPGIKPVDAQSVIAFPTSEDFPHVSHDVRVEPGKNFWGEWIPSALHPASAIAAKTSSVRRESGAPIRLLGTLKPGMVLSESQSQCLDGKKN